MINFWKCKTDFEMTLKCIVVHVQYKNKPQNYQYSSVVEEILSDRRGQDIAARFEDGEGHGVAGGLARRQRLVRHFCPGQFLCAPAVGRFVPAQTLLVLFFQFL